MVVVFPYLYNFLCSLNSIYVGGQRGFTIINKLYFFPEAINAMVAQLSRESVLMTFSFYLMNLRIWTCTAQNGFTRPREIKLQIFSDECPGFTNMDLYNKFICTMTPNNETLCKITEKFLINMVNIMGHL